MSRGERRRMSEGDIAAKLEHHSKQLDLLKNKKDPSIMILPIGFATLDGKEGDLLLNCINVVDGEARLAFTHLQGAKNCKLAIAIREGQQLTGLEVVVQDGDRVSDLYVPVKAGCEISVILKELTGAKEGVPVKLLASISIGVQVVK